MNSNPNAQQKRYQNELREMCLYKYGGKGEMHHIFGSKYKRRVFNEDGSRVERVGEWLVIFLPKQFHDNIKQYTFEDEREAFLMQIPVYEDWYEKPFPVPKAVIESYKNMKHRHEPEKGLGYGLAS